MIIRRGKLRLTTAIRHASLRMTRTAVLTHADIVPNILHVSIFDSTYYISILLLSYEERLKCLIFQQ